MLCIREVIKGSGVKSVCSGKVWYACKVKAGKGACGFLLTCCFGFRGAVYVFYMGDDYNKTSFFLYWSGKVFIM